MGNMENIIVLLIVLFVIGFLLGLYFLPAILALVLHNKNALAICLLNFFTGWTFVGWVASLIWAVII